MVHVGRMTLPNASLKSLRMPGSQRVKFISRFARIQCLKTMGSYIRQSSLVTCPALQSRGCYRPARIADERRRRRSDVFIRSAGEPIEANALTPLPESDVLCEVFRNRYQGAAIDCSVSAASSSQNRARTRGLTVPTHPQPRGRPQSQSGSADISRPAPKSSAPSANSSADRPRRSPCNTRAEPHKSDCPGRSRKLRW